MSSGIAPLIDVSEEWLTERSARGRRVALGAADALSTGLETGFSASREWFIGT